MKLLLDENLPKRLKFDLKSHEVFTVADQGWTGKKNGELLSLMISNNFEVLLTFDKNLQYQQNFLKYSIAVLVLSAPNNTYRTLSKLSDQVLEKLKTKLPSGPIEIKLV